MPPVHAGDMTESRERVKLNHPNRIEVLLRAVAGATSSSGNGQRLELTASHPEGNRRSNRLCRIRLRLCQDPQDFRVFREIIDTYHTYKPSKRSPGRKLCWLIESTGSEIFGSIAVHSEVLTIKARDDFFGWNRDQRVEVGWKKWTPKSE